MENFYISLKKIDANLCLSDLFLVRFIALLTFIVLIEMTMVN